MFDFTCCTQKRSREVLLSLLCLSNRLCACSHSRVALDQLAPCLAQLNQGTVPMPQTGAAAMLMASPLAATAASSQIMLTIEKVDATIKVLNTKTRPKRLQLLGSDGHTYNFLLKVCHQPLLLNSHCTLVDADFSRMQ